MGYHTKNGGMELYRDVQHELRQEVLQPGAVSNKPKIVNQCTRPMLDKRFLSMVVHTIQRGRLIGVSTTMSVRTRNNIRCVVGTAGSLGTRKWIFLLVR